MPRRNRRDTDNVVVRTRKAHREPVLAGVLRNMHDTDSDNEREPEMTGQR
jgi:hypothetical protein